jgi:hypothetical protein
LLEVHATVYPVMAAPLFAPGVKPSLSDPVESFAALSAVGAAGAPTTTGVDTLDAPAPRALAARAVQV